MKLPRPLALPFFLLSSWATFAPPVAAQVTPSRGPWFPRRTFETFDLHFVDVADHVPRLRVALVPGVGTSADLYVRHGAPPDFRTWDARSATAGTSAESLVLGNGTTPRLASGRWWIGVARQQDTTYTLDVARETEPSHVSGLGSVLYDDGPNHRGASFRVFAPFAAAVRVATSRGGWNATDARLHDEGNGFWSLAHRGIRAGDQYRYVLETPQGIVWRNDPHARLLTSSVGNTIVVDPSAFLWTNTNFTMPPWNEVVLYELHVGTFSDLPGGPPGTFDTARTRLPYLADLGVNAIEVMPVSEFPGDFSWGYNPSYPWSVETAYGGVDAFRRFVDEAHGHGIAVLLDVVHNHYGPTDLDLWRFDGWSLGPWGGIYFYNDLRAQTPWGDTRPDYGRGEVRQYIRDNALMWLEEYRLDGLRWDSTSSMRMGPTGDIPEGWSLLQWANDSIDQRQPWKLSIAEDLYNAPNEWITRSTTAGGAGFDGQWDALFVHPIRRAIIGPDDNARNLWEVRNAIAQTYNGDAFRRVIYTESHDEVANGRQRVPEEIWPGNAGSWYSKKRSTLGAALTLTAPGMPMLFQGQEILEDGYFRDDDPVDWSKLTTYAGIHRMYRDMIRMRRNLDGTTRGLTGRSTNVFHVNDGDKVIAFHRWDRGGAGDDVIVMANFRNRSWSRYRIGLPRAGTWRVRFNSDWNGYDPTFANTATVDVTAQAFPYDGMSHSAELAIGPYTAVILSQ